MMLPSQKNDRNFVTYFILAFYNVTAYVPTDHYVKGWVLKLIILQYTAQKCFFL